MQKKMSIATWTVQILSAAALAATTCAVQAQQPAAAGTTQAGDWFPSRWGADDEIGAANHMTPQRIVEAAKLVKTGAVYELGITVSPTTPAFPPRDCKLYVVQPGQQAGGSLGHTKTTYNDDILSCWIGIGSQLDGLGHIGIDNVHYNGHKVADFAQPTGLTKLGVEKVPPMVARGVLLDEGCCDPLYRKAIRVSVGAALTTPFARTEGDAAEVLLGLGYHPLALSPEAGERLADLRLEGPVAIIVGAEGPGLSESLMARCRRVSIPMAHGWDSLNVATAAAIALHHLRFAAHP